MEWLFWISLGLVAYAYAGYPVLLAIIAGLVRRTGAGTDPGAESKSAGSPLPTVTIIIPAYNEELSIESKLESFLALDYPADRLELIVCSDGSTDGTKEKVHRYLSPRLKLIAHPDRRGKMQVLNEAVSKVSSEIVVFSDAEARFHPQALRRLVRHFQSPKVAAVFGWREMRGGREEAARESVYWRYEKWIRRAEDQIGATIVCSGAILALRRRAYRPLAAHLICDDLFIPLDLRVRGWQLVFEPAAVVYEQPTSTLAGDFLRRVRLGAGGFQSLRFVGANLKGGDLRGLFAYVSHKLLRWLTPFFLLSALWANLALLKFPLYQGLLAAELALCGFAFYGFWQEKQGRPVRFLGPLCYFLAMNLAFLLGAFRYLGGGQEVKWEKIETRPSASA